MTLEEFDPMKDQGIEYDYAWTARMIKIKKALDNTLMSIHIGIDPVRRKRDENEI